MPNEVITTVSLSVAVSQWETTVDALTTALEEGIDGARQLEDGGWEIPTGWLDDTYVRTTVIDLRDVGSELSVVLDHLLSTRDKLGEAEVRAVKAETETTFLQRDIVRLESEVRRAESDAEHWMAQHDEREEDLVAERIRTAEALASGEETRHQLVETEGRLDGTYHDLLEAKADLAEAVKKSSWLSRRIGRKKGS